MNRQLIMSQGQQTEFGSSQVDPSEPDINTISFTGSHRVSNCYNRGGSSFVQPSAPPSIPPEAEDIESFQQVIGPDKRPYFLYDAMNHSNWVDWWIHTNYGSTNATIPWDSQHGSASETWKEYEQAADAVFGSPKVMCKRCGAFLEHPYSTKQPTGKGKSTEKVNRHGTTTISRHLDTVGCKRAIGKQKQKGAIRGFFQSVCTILSFFYTTY